MIALASILEQLAAADGSSSPTPSQGGGPTVGPVAVDFSCLSTQGQALLRGKGHWQERVELMHLHTTTHGTRRWSGGGDKDLDHEEKSEKSEKSEKPEKISPKGPSDNAFSVFSAHSRSRLPTPTTSSSVSSISVAPPTVSAVSAVSANPFAAAAAAPLPAAPPVSLGPAVRPLPVLSQLNLGLGSLALRGGASKGTGSASVTSSTTGCTSSSLSPRNKASAVTMKESLAVMNTSLASLSGSQRIAANSSGKGNEKSVSFQKVGDENLKTVNK